MKRFIQGIVSLLLCFSMLFSFIACGSDDNGYIESDGKKTIPENVMKIGDYDISFEEYRYYYLNVKASYDNGDDKYWDENEEKFDTVKADTEGYIKNMYSMLAIAKDYGIELDSDDEASVDKQISDAKSTYGEDTYNAQLEAGHMSEELYRDSLEKVSIYNKIFDKLFSDGGEYAWTDEEYRSYLKENYYCAMHILVPFESGEGTIVSDKTLEKANEIYNKAIAGDDFWGLILEYGSDENMENYKEGYFVTEGDMSDEFYNTLKELDIGSISKPLMSANGFYIIKRMDFTEEGIKNEKESVLNGYIDDNNEQHDGVYNKKFTELCNEKGQSLDISYDESYSLITPKTIN